MQLSTDRLSPSTGTGYSNGRDETLRWTFDGQEGFFVCALYANRHAVGPGEIALTVVLVFSLASSLVAAYEEPIFDFHRHGDGHPGRSVGSVADPTRGQRAYA
jgi:hypothetical protein